VFDIDRARSLLFAHDFLVCQEGVAARGMNSQAATAAVAGSPSALAPQHLADVEILKRPQGDFCEPARGNPVGRSEACVANEPINADMWLLGHLFRPEFDL
jgi:hypothetical protein